MAGRCGRASAPQKWAKMHRNLNKPHTEPLFQIRFLADIAQSKYIYLFSPNNSAMPPPWAAATACSNWLDRILTLLQSRIRQFPIICIFHIEVNNFTVIVANSDRNILLARLYLNILYLNVSLVIATTPRYYESRTRFSRTWIVALSYKLVTS